MDTKAALQEILGAGKLKDKEEGGKRFTTFESGEPEPKRPVTITTGTGFVDEPHESYEVIVWDSPEKAANPFDQGPFGGDVHRWDGKNWSKGRYQYDPNKPADNIHENDFYGDTDPAEQFVSIDRIREKNPEVAKEIDRIVQESGGTYED